MCTKRTVDPAGIMPITQSIEYISGIIERMDYWHSRMQIFRVTNLSSIGTQRFTDQQQIDDVAGEF